MLHLLAQTQEERSKWIKALGKQGSTYNPTAGGSVFVSRSTFVSNAARAAKDNPYATIRGGDAAKELSSHQSLSDVVKALGASSPTITTTTTTATGEEPPAEEDVDDTPPETQIVKNGWGQQRTNSSLIGMFGLWTKCYMSLIGEDLLTFKDMR